MKVRISARVESSRRGRYDCAARVGAERIDFSFCTKQHKFSQLDERGYGCADPGGESVN